MNWISKPKATLLSIFDIRVMKVVDADEAAAIRARWVILFLLLASTLVGLLQAYIFFFEKTATVDTRNQNEVSKVLTSGDPYFFACLNTYNKNDADVFEQAGRQVSDVVKTAYINCSAVLPSGRTIAQKLKLNGNARPLWFLVHHGKQASQLMPSKSADSLEKEIRSKLKNNVQAIKSNVDLRNCINDRIGGCFILYSTRPTAIISNELNNVVKSIEKAQSNPLKTIKLATLDASLLRLTTKDDISSSNQKKSDKKSSEDEKEEEDGYVSLFKTYVAHAKQVAEAVGETKIQILVAMKRTSFVEDKVLVSFHSLEYQDQISMFDFSVLQQRQTQAISLLNESSVNNNENDNLIDALLERDDKLLKKSSVLVDPSSFVVTHSKKVEQQHRINKLEAEKAERLRKQQEQQQQQRANEASSGGTSNRRDTNIETREDLTPEQVEAIKKAKERLQRKRMDEETEESSFVAWEASDEDEEGEGALPGEVGRDEEDIVLEEAYLEFDNEDEL
jgi:hypothetical protein